MQIQQISFGAKQRFDYNKTRSNETLDTAISKFENQHSMFQLGKNALEVVPTLKEASKFAKKKSRGILYDSKQIQKNANSLMEKIKNDSAYKIYVEDSKNKRTLSQYPTEIEFDKKIYDVTIRPHKIIAVERIDNNVFTNKVAQGDLCGCKMEHQGKDVYEFNTQTGGLMYFAHGLKKEGLTTSIEKEYKFHDGDLYQYGEGVAKGDFELINQRFKFALDSNDKNCLRSFSTMTRTAWDKECADRIFEFDEDGYLVHFVRNFKEDLDGSYEWELLYQFDAIENLESFKKDFEEGPFYSAAKTRIEFEGKNKFYSYVDYDTRTDSIYKTTYQHEIN